MMTDLERIIEENIERNPLDVALDKSLCPELRREVAQRVKYLQRAKLKLPSYYDARCLIEAKAFEQSSSEAVAAAKSIKGGELALDMTGGLGVDTVELSRRFRSVTTLERDVAYADLLRENLRRLKVANVEVKCTDSELFVREYCGERFDLIYCDPDRRGADGSKRVVLEECSPDVVALMPRLQELSDRVVIKCSPMFDVDEAFRLFGEEVSVEVISHGGECKEVVIEVGGEHAGMVGATAVGDCSMWNIRGARPKGLFSRFEPAEYATLVVPDVTLQKGRMARLTLAERCDIWSDNGYGFSRESGVVLPLTRSYSIERIERYEPKRLKRVLREMGIERAEVMKREFPYSVAQVTRQLGIKEGGARRIALTKVEGINYCIILR